MAGDEESIGCSRSFWMFRTFRTVQMSGKYLYTCTEPSVSLYSEKNGTYERWTGVQIRLSFVSNLIFCFPTNNLTSRQRHYSARPPHPPSIFLDNIGCEKNLLGSHYGRRFCVSLRLQPSIKLSWSHWASGWLEGWLRMRSERKSGRSLVVMATPLRIRSG